VVLAVEASHYPTFTSSLTFLCHAFASVFLVLLWYGVRLQVGVIVPFAEVAFFDLLSTSPLVVGDASALV